MAEKKIEKGSDEWLFFQEYFKFRTKYHDPDNNDAWFDELKQVATELNNKYKNTDFSDYAEDMIMSHLNDIDRKYKKRGEKKP